VAPKPKSIAGDVEVVSDKDRDTTRPPPYDLNVRLRSLPTSRLDTPRACYNRAAASFLRCIRSRDSNSAATILSARIQSISVSGTLADMTPELARSAAEVLRRQILKRPKSGSRRPSRPRPAARTG
jgi:hypothetical protein